jgi:hypothetical protein
MTDKSGFFVSRKGDEMDNANFRTTDNCNNCIHGSLRASCKITAIKFGGGWDGSKWSNYAARHICDLYEPKSSTHQDCPLCNLPTHVLSLEIHNGICNACEKNAIEKYKHNAVEKYIKHIKGL